MPADLLFEIGCEEIPAKMLARALVELPELVGKRLDDRRLARGAIRAYGTPRRLAVLVTDLAERQPDLREEVVGPPASAAFGADGAPTKAGIGFAAKNGVDPAALHKKEVAGKKGLYAVAQRDVAGEDTRALLPPLLADLAGAIAWPKSQRWGWGETRYVRPVQWLVALFGGEVVPVAWAGLVAGRETRGHRFLSPGGIQLAAPAAYVEALATARVLVDPEARTARVRDELARLERETGLRVRPDEALLGEVIHLGEYPVGVCGAFDASYLEVPEEIIVTAMRTHQRYFAMEDAAGKLANRFATMMATQVTDPAVVRRGNEYVIAARLADAKFFVAEDRKSSFAAWNARLDSVVFQQKLGEGARTIGDKVRRIARIAADLAAGVESSPPRSTIDASIVRTAAEVCKADLASKAVNEFPELQGVMGRHYAADFGHPEAVARAIDEHWSPRGQGGALPASEIGAILAIADRMDTAVAMFSAGLEPSGNADPFGIRRAAIGIWLILLDRGWSGLWPVAFASARSALAASGVRPADASVGERLEKFFRDRLRGIFLDQGIPGPDADAVLAQDFRDPVDALARAKAIAKIPPAAREVFKRTANILDDARTKSKLTIGDTVDPSLFARDNTVEQRLHDGVAAARTREVDARARRDYAAVFESLVELQPTVAAFFDKGGVMVMDPDAALRDNRLALLNWFIAPYMAIADFRLLVEATR